MDLADHLTGLSDAKIVRQLSNKHTEHILSQRDGFDVWEEQVVEHIRAAWEKSQADHAEDNLV